MAHAKRTTVSVRYKIKEGQIKGCQASDKKRDGSTLGSGHSVRNRPLNRCLKAVKFSTCKEEIDVFQVVQVKLTTSRKGFAIKKKSRKLQVNASNGNHGPLLPCSCPGKRVNVLNLDTGLRGSLKRYDWLNRGWRIWVIPAHLFPCQGFRGRRSAEAVAH